MKILRIEKGEYETIETDETFLNIYRRIFIDGDFPTFSWEHWLGDTNQWLRLFDHTQLEDCYQLFIKEQSDEKIQIN